MIQTQKSVTMAATTGVIDLGGNYEKCIVFMPALATDTELTLGLSYDGTTYLTLNRIEGADNQTDVIVNASRCQMVELGGARYIQFTGSNAQTCTIYVIAMG